MFGDVNKVQLMGNLVKDPELRFTPSGAAVLNFSIATNRNYKVGEEWKEEVTFHNIVSWRSAENLAKRLKKGSRVYIDGRIQTRSWDGDDGKKQYKTEVVVDNISLISRYNGSEELADIPSADDAPSSSKGSSDETIDPDDLPF